MIEQSDDIPKNKKIIISTCGVEKNAQVNYLKKIKAKKFYGTLDDIETLEKFCSGCEVIIHSAAMISIGLDSYDDVYKVNYIGTKNLLKACIKKNVKKFFLMNHLIL